MCFSTLCVSETSFSLPWRVLPVFGWLTTCEHWLAAITRGAWGTGSHFRSMSWIQHLLSSAPW